jgi:hypothetical protein
VDVVERRENKYITINANDEFLKKVVKKKEISGEKKKNILLNKF